MTRSAQRITGLFTLIAAAAVLALSLSEMTSRLQQRRPDEAPSRWATRRIADSSFAYRAAPVVIEPAHDSASAAPVVLVRWGDAAPESLPVTGREDPRLPELLRHDDWLRVFEVREVEPGADPAAPEPGAEHKVIVVARAPAPGYDPETWGRVRRKDWTYTFLELLPSGAIERTTISRSALPAGSWQEVAALQITPGVKRSAALHLSQSMMHPGKAPEETSFSSLGWTWTAAGLAVMGLVVGSMLFGASFITGWRAGAQR